MSARFVILIASLVPLLFPACSGPAAQKQPAFDTTLTTKELMRHVIDPAAIALWGRAGEMETEKGTITLTPETPEDWKLAENEAAMVAEAGNMLLLPGRVRELADGDVEWTKFAKGMTTEALAVWKATVARDGPKMFETGAALYQTCVACHEKYYIPFLEDGQTTDAPNAGTKP